MGWNHQLPVSNDFQLSSQFPTAYPCHFNHQREASQRPLSLAKQSLSLLRNSLALLGYGAAWFFATKKRAGAKFGSV